MKKIKCPKSNGGCGASDRWSVTINEDHEMIHMDCNCGYRMSFFIDMDKSKTSTGPIETDEVR